MIINHTKRWVYIGPPKTGSTTLHTELVKARFGGIQVWPGIQHDADLPPGTEDYFKFATVRNPYSRAASLYWHFLIEYRMREAAAADVTPEYLLPFRTDLFSFCWFLEAITNSRLPMVDQSEKGQDFYVQTTSWWLKDVSLDATVQLESLESQFQQLPIWTTKDVLPNFGHYNAPGTPAWRFMRNPAAIELIDHWAAEDFDKYGYPRITGAARGVK